MAKKSSSPGRLTARRFFRNRLAVVGLGILSVMFLFSFLGGALSPYGQDQVFYRDELRAKAYAAVTENDAYRFTTAPGRTLDGVQRAGLTLALNRGQTEAEGYTLAPLGRELFGVYAGETLLALAHKDLLYEAPEDFSFHYSALVAYANGAAEFWWEGSRYTLDELGVLRLGATEAGYISRLVLRAREEGVTIGPELREAIVLAVQENAGELSFQGRRFALSYSAPERSWQVTEQTLTRVWDSYAPPSGKHLLGTDKNGMDVLTRLMYGGRISLVIGFIVVFIAGALGVLLGGTAGYFGGWADNAIMRLVDVFYCIPSTPVLIILGAAMDAMRVDPRVRMLLLMLILGFLGWPGIARLVRGQILSLREQEFMTATEAVGLRAHRRIFRHLLPNVIPQLIVACTMSLGSTILTEATLSFLGLGVKFPFASWGNIMNDVASAHVLTSYWFVWIPAGICLVLSVLGFNFIGDGLRDAFDPKMKR